MGAVVLAVDHELRHDYSVIGSSPHRTDPPFGGREMRGMHGESLVVRVPRGRCFQTSYVGSMAQLSLRITSHDLILFCLLKEQFMLFRGTLIAKGDLELASGFANCWGVICYAYQEHTMHTVSKMLFKSFMDLPLM